MWFTGDPMELLKFARNKDYSEEYYKVAWRGRTWEWSEVPVEVGSYFMRKSEYGRALAWGRTALDANAKSGPALALLAEACEKTGDGEGAAGYRRALEALK